MNCEEVERNDILAAYIAGKLPEAERDQFEEHFFGCEECLQQVEAARIARDVLIANPLAKKPRMHWWVPALAVAAVLVVGIAVWKSPVAEPQKVAPVVVAQAKPSYELLARFDPPVYRASTLRSATRAPKSFASAMKLYSAGDFAGAAVGLRELDTTVARFYLGVSELLAGDRGAGVADLKKTVEAGDTPYQSEARFYLAKGLLGEAKVDEARVQLETLVREKGELAQLR